MYGSTAVGAPVILRTMRKSEGVTALAAAADASEHTSILTAITLRDLRKDGRECLGSVQLYFSKTPHDIEGNGERRRLKPHPRISMPAFSLLMAIRFGFPALRV